MPRASDADLPEQPIAARCHFLGHALPWLAAESGFNLRTIDNWVNRRRKPTPPQLERLARALDCTPADLFDEHAPAHQAPTNPNRRPWGANNKGPEAAAERFAAARARAEEAIEEREADGLA